MDDRQFWVLIRAARINQAKALEQQRREILAEIAAIERRWSIEPKEQVRQVRIADTDTLATAVITERV